MSVVCTHGFGLLVSLFDMRGADVRKIKDRICKIQCYASRLLELGCLPGCSGLICVIILSI